MLSDFVIGHLRTWTPIWVGAGLTWLSDNWGVSDIDTATAAMVATSVVASAYYLVVRLVAERVPWVGSLLGPNKAPTYTDG